MDREARQRVTVRLTAQEAFLVKYLEHVRQELHNTISTNVEPDSELELRDAFRMFHSHLVGYRRALNRFRGETTTTLQDAESLVEIIQQEWKKELGHIPEMVTVVEEAIDR